MSLDAARVVAALLEGYAVAGLIFAALFLPRGIVRVDPLVGHSPLAGAAPVRAGHRRAVAGDGGAVAARRRASRRRLPVEDRP